MFRIRVLGAAAATAALAAVVTASPASAELISQGRSYGSTAYGSAASLEMRRPGVPNGTAFYSKVGAKIDSSGLFYFIGYKSDSTGYVTWIRERHTYTSYSATPLLYGSNTPSYSRVSASISQGRSGYFTYLIRGTYDDYYKEESTPTGYFTDVIAKNQIPDGSSLSRSSQTELKWQPSIGGNFRYWGSPTPVSAPSPACGWFSGTTVYYYAFNQPC